MKNKYINLIRWFALHDGEGLGNSIVMRPPECKHRFTLRAAFNLGSSLRLSLGTAEE